MKFVILGAGAMGCLIGGRLQRVGHEVSFLARGKKLAALQRGGLTLETEGDHWEAPVHVFADTKTIGPVDAVLLTTKSYQLPDIAPLIPPLLGNDTVIVPMTNGLPWWYFFKRGGNFSDRPLVSLDPSGALSKHGPIARIIGGVNYLAGTELAPGHVHYVNELERRLVVGELDGSISPRLETLGKAFDDAGFAAKRSNDIRQVVWHKLWGNLAFNPISALTGGTQEQLTQGDLSLIIAVMDEGRKVGEALGIKLDQTTESRIAAARKMKAHRTSMFTDITHGRPTEIEAIVGVVREIAGWLKLPTPHLDCLYTLVRLKEQFYAAAMAEGSGHT